MTITDILIILIILLGAYFGYVNGFIKQLSDTIILYIMNAIGAIKLINTSFPIIDFQSIFFI